MKSFLYIQVKENSKFYVHNLINCDSINTMHRDKTNDTEKDIIVIIDKQDNKIPFIVCEIVEVITNNKYVSRFFRNAGIKADLEENKEENKEEKQK